MNNPWSGKWAIMVFRFGDFQFQDRFYGFLTRHSEVIECEEPNECWLNDHNDPVLYDKLEYAEIYCNTVSDQINKYIPIQIP